MTRHLLKSLKRTTLVSEVK